MQTWQCGVNRRCVPPFFVVHYPQQKRDRLQKLTFEFPARLATSKTWLEVC